MHTYYPFNTTFPPKRSPPAFGSTQLLSFFLQLLPRRALYRLPALQGLRFYDRLFLPIVTLWYLLFQRLNPDHSLEAALADARAGGAKALNRKLATQLRSNSTASYSDARQRLPTDWLAQALRLQGAKITGLSSTALWKGWAVALLDGSTVRLRPYGDIPKQFTLQRNQRKSPYWCLMRVTLSFCCFTGAALDCAMGSMKASEPGMAAQIIAAALGRCLFIGDRALGVFRVVQAARQKNHSVLLRLTKVRARKVLGRSLRQGDHRVLWSPSPHDQLQPQFSQQSVAGRLLIRQLKRAGFRAQTLYLFTTLEDAAQYSLEQLFSLYGLRWHIELNLRYVKAQMDSHQLEAHSAQMARKEWLASLLAYNLIRAAMLCAALHKGLCLFALSFSASRRRLEQWLLRLGRTRSAPHLSWTNTLEEIARCLLPRRRPRRPSEPRAQRHLRAAYPPFYGSRAAGRRKLKWRRAKS